MTEPTPLQDDKADTTEAPMSAEETAATGEENAPEETDADSPDAGN